MLVIRSSKENRANSKHSSRNAKVLQGLRIESRCRCVFQLYSLLRTSGLVPKWFVLEPGLESSEDGVMAFLVLEKSTRATCRAEVFSISRPLSDAQWAALVLGSQSGRGVR